MTNTPQNIPPIAINYTFSDNEILQHVNDIDWPKLCDNYAAISYGFNKPGKKFKKFQLLDSYKKQQSLAFVMWLFTKSPPKKNFARSFIETQLVYVATKEMNHIKIWVAGTQNNVDVDIDTIEELLNQMSYSESNGLSALSETVFGYLATYALWDDFSIENGTTSYRPKKELSYQIYEPTAYTEPVSFQKMSAKNFF